jgi:hypothetical protein
VQQKAEDGLLLHGFWLFVYSAVGAWRSLSPISILSGFLKLTMETRRESLLRKSADF